MYPEMLYYNQKETKEVNKMKIIRTTNSIISLENVRRVELHEYSSQHTRAGQKYSIDHYRISIVYCDDKSEHIECGDNKEGREKSEQLMDKIFEILKKEA